MNLWNVFVTLETLTVFYQPVSGASTYAGFCKININEQLPSVQPLILHAGSSQPLQPQTADVISVHLRKRIRLVCPGANNSFAFGKLNSLYQDVSPHCVINNIFSPGSGFVYPIDQMGCKTRADATAVLSGHCLNKKYSRIQIGFDLPKGEFSTTVNVCFDQQNYDAVYSAFTLTPNIIGRQHNVSRPDFEPSTFYHKLDVKSLYIRQKQRSTISQILGSSELGKKYVKNDQNYYLARGHLSAKADFIYGTEQRSTFFYMNVAPQWQIFNAGNWEVLESDVRNYASNRTTELIVITGIWGTCSLPDVKGKLKPLYLYVDNNNNRAVRVPGYYWKVLYDPKTKEGAAFVGINNPYLKEVTKEHVFCKDICENFKWLKWDKTNIKKGYSFCCSIDEFRETVKTVPEFPVESVLL